MERLPTTLRELSERVRAGGYATVVEPGEARVYDVGLWFGEFELELAGTHTRAVLFGAPPKVHDAGGLLDGLLQADLAHSLPW